jgi:DNA-binding response OmpR family regulator
LLWGAFSFAYLRKNQQTEEISVTNFGGLSYSENEGRFYDATQLPIHFTPMQQQFMNLLWEAPSHTLSKKEICDALWPGKEDANDTLYTLVRRLKPVIEQHTDLKITADRCGRYILKIKDID